MKTLTPTQKINLQSVFDSKKQKSLLLVGPMEKTLPPSLLKEGLIIGIDGGLELLSPEEYHSSIGDGDSLKNGKKSLLLKLPQAKDCSDFSAALAEFSFLVPKEWHLWGLQGGRFDHELSLWGDVSAYLSLCKDQIFHAHGPLHSWQAFCGKMSFTRQGTFSVYCLQESILTISGNIDYPLSQYPITSPSSLTLSNYASGPFSIESTSPCFVYWPKEESSL